MYTHTHTHTLYLTFKDPIKYAENCTFELNGIAKEVDAYALHDG